MSHREISSFEEYFQKYYEQSFKYILKKVSERQLAEDLAMDSFVSCYEKFDRFNPERATFQTWLYVVINNKLKNYYRDRKEFDEIDESMEFAGSFEDEVLAAEQIKNMRAVLAEALDTLPDIQRQIVILKYFKNRKSKDIGDVVGLSPGNVRVQLSRALDRLRNYFEVHNIDWEF